MTEDVESYPILIMSVMISVMYIVCLVLLCSCKAFAKKKWEQKLIVIKDVTDSFNAPYLVTIVTGSRPGAGTEGIVQLKLGGKCGDKAEFLLNPVMYDLSQKYFHRGTEDQFLLMTNECLEDVFTLDVQLHPRFESDTWFLSYILVQNVTTGEITYFPAHQWIRCEEKQATRIVLLAASTSQCRFLVDMFLRSLKNHHCWMKLLYSPGTSAFNTVLRVSYAACVLSCLLCAAALLFEGKGQESQHIQYSKVFAYSILSATLLSIKLWAIERALFYFEHRSRFENWMSNGQFVDASKLERNVGDGVNRIMDDLSSSIWEPYCHAGYMETELQPQAMPKYFDHEEFHTYDADWSPAITSQNITDQKSHWLELMENTSSANQSAPRQIALASDSEYAVYRKEARPVPKRSPRDDIPLNVCKTTVNYHATDCQLKSDINDVMDEEKLADMNITSAAAADFIPDLEPVPELVALGNDRQVNETDFSSRDTSKLQACYDNAGFDIEFPSKVTHIGSLKCSECASNDGTEKRCQEHYNESWVFVEKPMELVLKDAIEPRLNEIIQTEPQSIPGETDRVEINTTSAKYDSLKAVLQPLLQDIVQTVRISLSSGTNVSNKKLGEFKDKLALLLTLVKEQKCIKDKEPLEIQNPCSETRAEDKPSGACRSDSMLEKRQLGKEDSEYAYSKSQSSVEASRHSRQSVEEIHASLHLGPVAAKLSNMLIEFSISSQNIEQRLTTKSQQERMEMLGSLNNLVNGGKRLVPNTVGDLDTAKSTDIDIGGPNSDKNTIEYDADQPEVPVTINPVEVMSKIPAKFTDKLNRATMVQIANASLQSILSEETRARFNDIVASQCQNEAQAFVSDVVSSLFEIVSEKLKTLVDLENQRRENENPNEKLSQFEKDQLQGACAQFPPELNNQNLDQSSVDGNRTSDIQDLFESAQKDVEENVLPLLSEYLLMMLEKQATALDSLDIDLLMMLCGGQYVDTIITNAVLQTHVGVVQKARCVVEEGRDSRYQSLKETNPFKSLIEEERSMQNEAQNEGDSREDSQFNDGWSSVFKVKSDLENVEMVNAQTCELADTDENIGHFMNISLNNNCEVRPEMPHDDVTDVATVTSRVLEAVHEKLKQTSTDQLSALIDSGKIHCGLCRPKAIREIKRKVAAMAAGRHLTKQVYKEAFGEIQKLAGLKCSDPLLNTSSYVETELLQKVGKIILQENEEDQNAVATPLGCQETIERVAQEIVHAIMERAYDKAADDLIDILRLGSHASDGLDSRQFRNELQRKLSGFYLEEGQTMEEEERGLADVLGPRLSERDVQELSFEYEQIRNMLFEPKFNASTRFKFNDFESCPPCTYFRHSFTKRAKYRLSQNAPFMYVLFCVLAAITVTGLVLAAVTGLKLSTNASLYCLLSFTFVVFLHVLVLDPFKVLVLSLIQTLYFKKLP